MKFPTWILGSITASFLATSPVVTQADVIEPVSFLVSLTDEMGNHICNGSYIGNQHILTGSNCMQLSSGPVIPIPLPPGDTLPPIDITPIPTNMVVDPNSELFSQLSSGKMITQEAMAQGLQGQASNGLSSFDGKPTHAVFLLPEGDSALIPLERDFFFTKSDVYPVGGAELIYTVTLVPSGAMAIPLAGNDLSQKLLADDNTVLTLMGKYLAGSEAVTEQNHLVSDGCLALSANGKYQENLCFMPSPSRLCSSDRKSFGAPMVANDRDGTQVLIAMKANSGCNFFNTGNTFAAASRLVPWTNLQALKQQGLDVVSAYEFGSQKKRSHHDLTITMVNNSQWQKFDLTGFEMGSDESMRIKQNDCGTLLPEESCRVTLHTRVPHGLNYLERLSFNSLDLDAGINIALDAYEERTFSGDKNAQWHVNGWKSASGRGHIGERPKAGGSLYTSAEFSSYPVLTRKQYIDGPTTMHVTYRTDGNDQWVLGGNIFRKSLRATEGMITLGNFLPGTNGEWQTHTIEISQLGSYSVSLARGGISIFGDQPVDIEIRDVCFGECED